MTFAKQSRHTKKESKLTQMLALRENQEYQLSQLQIIILSIHWNNVRTMLEHQPNWNWPTSPTFPGFGGSDDPPWIQSMPDLAMFYLDLIEQAGLDHIHLIGNSLGGWLAAEILIRDRSRFQEPRPAGAGRHPRKGRALRRQLHLGPRGGGA